MQANVYMKMMLALVTLCASIVAGAANGPRSFETPEAAADALVDSIATHDDDTLKIILGSNYRSFIPSGGVAPEDITRFLAAWAKAHEIVKVDDHTALLSAGTAGWTLPVPIVARKEGWTFDTQAGGEEMRHRYIGRNELAAIQSVLAYTDAQQEYWQWTQGQGTPAYAARLLSTPGKKDGLFWSTQPGDDPSPLGARFAEARPGEPYHGYMYRILTAQGDAAQGGAKSYLKNGRMDGGYALIAWPASYGKTGVMSFMVNQDGVVYQANLGPGTDRIARATRSFNPGEGWTRADVTP
ncbi:DUF2950 domain-containing protein [Silvimonas amylolytica]|uniref:DUF2950 family protein n=1 Tax=Silvimonas amylolytica TaxID=449663 RepID=A0ABQ2PKE1_9NEIS|nr:DUF2950 domain-containing protein [Silvimonas amylolytica]GGP25808.1 hypothetical protein GCM10010971_16270 [Silvimonas amylolytica]